MDEAEKRVRARQLLDENEPRDALAAYYALYAPVVRSELFVHQDADGRTDGFLVRARTGLDLFRPLVTLRGANPTALADLVVAGVPAGRPVYLTAPEDLGAAMVKLFQTQDAALHRLYRVRPNRLQRLINVLAVTSRDALGGPRCEIRSPEGLQAVSGVNWMSARFAEVYVYTDPAVRGRGWGKSVVSQVAGLLLDTGRTPIYVVSEHNDYSIRLAEAVGFEDTGCREFVAQATRK
jgi:GNAT superfamily N-acetyltransferase